MSLVTSVIIICPIDSEYVYPTEFKWIDKVNDWLKLNYSYASEGCNLFRNILDIESISSITAGTKHPESCVYIGGFNYFHDKDFSDFFRELQWPNANLLIRNENWDDSPHLPVPFVEKEDYLYTNLENIPFTIKDTLIRLKK